MSPGRSPKREEPKSQSLKVAITPTALAILKQLEQKHGCSQAEIVERLLRGEITGGDGKLNSTQLSAQCIETVRQLIAAHTQINEVQTEIADKNVMLTNDLKQLLEAIECLPTEQRPQNLSDT